MKSHNISIPTYSWCKNHGKDQSGTWIDVEICSVIQRMRFIEPGVFRMGSPLNEPGRFENETPHHVQLTQAFWMADTTCTQELWQAVMHENPSEFKGLQRPVDNINYEDCLRFFETANDSLNCLHLRLPTEAQWEFACRAGTQTPYFFGETVSSQLVNYNKGNFIFFYNDTIDVKALPPNGWGLYQMHGNVREWCADWYGEYNTGDAIDPVGPENGEQRVLRGGSWFSRARGCRSAARLARPSNRREDNYGFRFVLDA